MKNTLLPLALAAAGLFAIPAIGHAQSTDGAFINGNIGRASLDRGAFDDSDTGYGINAGYRWAVSPNALIGFEGGYTDLGKYSANLSDDVGPLGRATAELDGWTLGANGHFNVSPNWYISARGGWFRADMKSRLRSYDPAVSPDVNYSYSRTANGWYAGAGFGYDFSNNFSLGLNYDYYSADKSGVKMNPYILSVSSEYRF